MFNFDWFENLDLFDIGVLGGLSEELADDEKNIKKIEKDFDSENSDEDDNFI